MRAEHILRIPVPDFQRTHIHIFVLISGDFRVDIQKQLCGVAYFGDGIKRMTATDYREVCYRIQREQKWARKMEEISHQQIRCPGLLQL